MRWNNDYVWHIYRKFMCVRCEFDNKITPEAQSFKRIVATFYGFIHLSVG